MESRLENAFAYTPYARVKDDGLPGLRTMEFWAPTISPEERAEHYSLLSEQQRISTPRLRLKSTDLDKKDPGVDKAKERKIPSAPEVGTVAPEPIKDETPRQQTGRYEAKTGKTWFDYNGKEVWADMDTLQGVGVLPDGTFVNAAKGDRFAKPVYEVIYQRDSGQISKEEADQLLDAYAWEIAESEYPDSEDSQKREALYKERSRVFKTRTIDYYTIPDITDWFNEFLNTETIKTTKKINNIFENNLQDSDSGYFQVITYLINQFKNGAPYDLKRTERFQEHSLFQYNGEIVSRDALGNFMFGYVMSGCGFTRSEMEEIGGRYQKIGGDRSQKNEGAKGDDPRDRDRIFEGAEYYEEKWK